MTSLSVIVISLNEGDFLRRTVDNLLDTLPPSTEIIVVDDGSKDGSTDFLSDADGYPSVTLLRSAERLGVPRGEAIQTGTQSGHETHSDQPNAHLGDPH